MILTAAFSASSSDSAAWLALPLRVTSLGGEGVLGTALTEVSAVAIASGVLLGVLSLLAGLRWGGRRPARVTVPLRTRDARQRADRRARR
jgi:hypothetical protein